MASQFSLISIIPLQFLFIVLLLLTTSSADNIQTFFPSLPSPAFANFPLTPPPPPLTIPSVPATRPRSSNNGRLTKAIIGTAIGSFGFSSLLFVAFLLFTARKREHPDVAPHPSKFHENGLNPTPWYSEFKHRRCPHCNKQLLLSHRESSTSSIDTQQQRQQEQETTEPPSSARGRRRIQEAPLLPDRSIRSTSKIFQGSLSSPDRVSPSSTISPPAVDGKVTQETSSSSTSTSGRFTSPVQLAIVSSVPPPTTLPAARGSLPRVGLGSGVAPLAPPPAPSSHKQRSSTMSMPPPPPPPPALPQVRISGDAAPGNGQESCFTMPILPPAPVMATAAGVKKMKPLHWDKLNPGELEHSVVWNKMSGSFKFDEDIMEALFGTVATSKTNTKARNTSTTTFTTTSGATKNQAQICLLDPRKSQNIAIVLHSMSLSRYDVLSALKEGHGLTVDILEKLTKIAPTKDEETLITNYSGNPTKLADAESFLFHILCAVPSPFARLDAMLFKSNYVLEVKHHKQSLNTLELACNELKNQRVFLKLLEVVLKTGNRMNAGTSRGNAQAFNLSALNKLADVKSTDGSTTLLHFVVQEVVRSEGKHLVMNHNYNLRRSESSSKAAATLDKASSQVEQQEGREYEYVKYGLPIVGGLSSEFNSVKRAASIDYEMLLGTSSTLGARVDELKRFLETCGSDRFVVEMKKFVKKADDDMKLVKKEQARVLELVKQTTEYYQPGASQEKEAQPLTLFVIVRDFLDMVDKACIDIAKDQQQKKKQPMQAVGSGSKFYMKPQERSVVQFLNLPVRFMSDHSNSDSDSDEENGRQ